MTFFFFTTLTLFLNKRVIPDKYIIKAKDPIEAQQMDGNFYSYQNILRPAKISFETNCGKSTEYSLPKDSVWVRDLSLNTDLILGLSFLLKDNGSIMISKDFMQLQIIYSFYFHKF